MYSKQMEMFGEGGLKDQGGTKDKASGNDVPSGSLKKEVRDDIPAMVSEGEFILPADVVRYHGLEKLMGLRQEAKAGLQVMEKMGQMGNSEEAEIPDDLPFSLDDIIVINDDNKKEMAEGGLLFAQEGADVQDMMYRRSENRPTGLGDIQSPYEIAMGGPNKYDSKRVAYKDKDGKIVYILEDYMKRPQQSTEGLTRVESLKPDDGDDTADDTVIPEEEDKEGDALERRREEKRKERRQAEKAIRRKEQAAQAMKTSAERLGIPLEEYEELPMSARLGLIGQEMRIMAGGKLDTSARDKVLADAEKAGDGFFAGVGNRLKDFFGIGDDDDDAPKAPTPNAPLPRPSSLGTKGTEAPKLEEGTSDAEEFAMMTQGTPADLRGPSGTYDEMVEQSKANTPIVASGDSDDLGTAPTTVASAQFGQTPVGSLPSGPPLPDELSYTQGMQRPSVPSVQPNTTEPAFTEIERKLPNLSQGNTTEGASRLIEGTSRKAMSDRQKRDMERRVRSKAREDKAEKERKRNMSKVDKKDRDRFRKRREEADKKESKESKEKNKKEADNVRDYGISGLKKGGLMKRNYP